MTMLKLMMPFAAVATDERCCEDRTTQFKCYCLAGSCAGDFDEAPCQSDIPLEICGFDAGCGFPALEATEHTDNTGSQNEPDEQARAELVGEEEDDVAGVTIGAREDPEAPAKLFRTEKDDIAFKVDIHQNLALDREVDRVVTAVDNANYMARLEALFDRLQQIKDRNYDDYMTKFDYVNARLNDYHTEMDKDYDAYQAKSDSIRAQSEKYQITIVVKYNESYNTKRDALMDRLNGAKYEATQARLYAELEALDAQYTARSAIHDNKMLEFYNKERALDAQYIARSAKHKEMELDFHNKFKVLEAHYLARDAKLGAAQQAIEAKMRALQA